MKHTMKKDKILLSAALPGLIAAAAIVLSIRIPVSPDRLAGFATILMLLGIAAVEYRVDWKKLLSR
jgi:hypothetical protein